MFTACVSVAEPHASIAPNQPIGVDADSDILLRTLAELAREGVPSLCNASYLNQKLNIKIGTGRLSESEISRVTVSEVAPVTSNNEFSSAIYGAYLSGSKKECYLNISFKKIFMCDATSSRIKNIVGVRDASYTAPDPHGSTQGIFYEIASSSGGSSKLYLGTTDEKCFHGFSVSSSGVEK